MSPKKSGFIHLIILILLFVVAAIAIVILLLKPIFVNLFVPQVTPTAPINSTVVKSPIPYPTSSDLSFLEFAILSTEGKLLITDENGLRTGYDVKSGKELEQIPGSDYYLDEFYGDASSTVPIPPATDGVIFLTIRKPNYGNYQLQIIGTQGKTYSVTIYESSPEGTQHDSTFVSGKFDSNIARYSFNYSKENRTVEKLIDLQRE